MLSLWHQGTPNPGLAVCGLHSLPAVASVLFPTCNLPVPSPPPWALLLAPGAQAWEMDSHLAPGPLLLHTLLQTGHRSPSLPTLLELPPPGLPHTGSVTPAGCFSKAHRWLSSPLAARHTPGTSAPARLVPLILRSPKCTVSSFLRLAGPDLPQGLCTGCCFRLVCLPSLPPHTAQRLSWPEDAGLPCLSRESTPALCSAFPLWHMPDLMWSVSFWGDIS